MFKFLEILRADKMKKTIPNERSVSSATVLRSQVNQIRKTQISARSTEVDIGKGGGLKSV